MLLTVIESVGKSIEGAGKSIYDPLAIHCLVVIAKYWFLPVQGERFNLPFSREELYMSFTLCQILKSLSSSSRLPLKKRKN